MAHHQLRTGSGLTARKKNDGMLGPVHRGSQDLRHAGIEFEARIVGGGPLRDKLERERDRLGLSDAVTFLGALSEDEANSLFSESDLFLFTGKVAPDGDRDGLPNVIPEAMSAGLVVIASPHGGAAEALEEGVTGFVRDPHRHDQWVELVQGLLAAPKKVISLRKAAATAARVRFDVKRTARELLVCLLAVFDENFIQSSKNSAK